MTLAERLKLLISQLAIPASRFAAAIGDSPQNISRYTRGVEAPATFLEKVYRAYPQLNPHWLLTGQGSIWLSPLQPLHNGNGTAGNIPPAADGLPNGTNLPAGAGLPYERVPQLVERHQFPALHEAELLRAQLAEKERLIRTQQDLIDVLRNGQSAQ